MAKRLTRADRATLADLVERYSREFIARAAMKTPTKRGRPKDDFGIVLNNAIAIHVAVEARWNGKRGTFGKAVEETVKAIQERNAGVSRWERQPDGRIRIIPVKPFKISTRKVREMHALVKQWLAEEDGHVITALCEQEKKRQYLPPSQGRVHPGNRLQSKGGYFPNLYTSKNQRAMLKRRADREKVDKK